MPDEFAASSSFASTEALTTRRPVRLLLLVALPVYLAAFVSIRPDRSPETWEYGEIAAQLLAGHGFALAGPTGEPVPTASQMPVYPLLLAGFRAFVPEPYVLLSILQVFLWLSASAVLARLSHRFLGANESVSALAIALWPPLIVYTLSYHPLVWRASALVFVIAAADACRRRASWQWAVVLGAALGFAAMVRATFWMLPLLFLPWAARRSARKALAALLVFAASVSFWIVRNRRVLDAWVPATTTAGLIALVGNRPDATGALDERSLLRAATTLPVELRDAPEPVQDAFYKEQVVSFWRERPLEALSLYVKKLVFLWSVRPGIGERYPPLLTVSYVVLWSVTLPLVVVGVFVARQRPDARAPLVFIGTWVALSLVYAVFVVNMRFRFEAEPLLVPYAVVALASAGPLRHRRHT